MKVFFWMDDANRSTAHAAGTVPESIELPAGELQVGDRITFPAVPNLVYQVAARFYESGPQQWKLQLIPARANK